MPPAVIAVISLVATVASTAISVHGQKKQREQMRIEAKNQQLETNLRSGQSQINDRNRAHANRMNAKQIAQEAGMKSEMAGRKGNVKKASMIAQMSRQGLSLEGESFEDVLKSDAMDTEMQQKFALYDGAKAQENLLFQAEGAETQAQVTNTFGDLKIHNIGVRKDNQITASRIKSAGTVASGIGKAASSVSGYYDTGTFGDGG